MRANQWYLADTENQMTEKQRARFDKSFASYVKYFNKLRKPVEEVLNESEYFEEYKQTRKHLVEQGKDLKSIPRQVAKEQTYERSYERDRVQYNLFHEREDFKKLHGNLMFEQFRRLTTESFEDYLWNDIHNTYHEQIESGISSKDASKYISKTYFGSVV